VFRDGNDLVLQTVRYTVGAQRLPFVPREQDAVDLKAVAEWSPSRGWARVRWKDVSGVNRWHTECDAAVYQVGPALRAAPWTAGHLASRSKTA